MWNTLDQICNCGQECPWISIWNQACVCAAKSTKQETEKVLSKVEILNPKDRPDWYFRVWEEVFYCWRWYEDMRPCPDSDDYFLSYDTWIIRTITDNWDIITWDTFKPLRLKSYMVFKLMEIALIKENDLYEKLIEQSTNDEKRFLNRLKESIEVYAKKIAESYWVSIRDYLMIVKELRKDKPPIIRI